MTHEDLEDGPPLWPRMEEVGVEPAVHEESRVDDELAVGVGVRCGHVDEHVAESARVPGENIRVEEKGACVFQLQRRLQIPR